MTSQSKMSISPKRLFLIDGLGALATASLLFFLLARLEHIFGMPQTICYLLSSVAATYSIYSLCCYFLIRQSRKPFLQIIAIADIVYSVATIVLMQYYYSQLTWLGLAYFICEIAIIGLLVFLELKTANTN
jgi:hypothetical protein